MSELLRVDELDVRYRSGRRSGGPAADVQAVAGVSFAVESGETVALVGESGCGKSTVAKAIVGLVRPHAGTIRVDGDEVDVSSSHAQRAFSRHVQMIFQDPTDSMNPRKTILQTLAQPLRHLRGLPKAEVRTEAARLLDRVELSPGHDFIDRYPHHLSGGQRQRVAIARALAPNPRLIVADEAISALDISTQVQILALLRELQTSTGVSFLFITHNLGAVRAFADRVLVMYLGRLVESGPIEPIFEHPRHPYTHGLLQACPTIGDHDLPLRQRALLSGEVPSPENPPEGCRFRPRCVHATDICWTMPPAYPVGAGHGSWCHHHDRVPPLRTTTGAEPTAVTIGSARRNA